ncbi:MAG TPA: prolyl oligopeptidase family serine peptidase [Flavisolibacter sp.]
MRSLQLLLILLVTTLYSLAQQRLAPLTVDKIMRDPSWIGTSPASPRWSADGRLVFSWNPEKAVADSLYFITAKDRTPRKSTVLQRRETVFADRVAFNPRGDASTYIKYNDVFYTDRSGKEHRVTETPEPESVPYFTRNGTHIVYSRSLNLYAWDIATGTTKQLTNFKRGPAPKDPAAALNAQERWLQRDQLQTSDVIALRKKKKEETAAAVKAATLPELRSIYLDDRNLASAIISPDERFVAYRLSRQAPGAKTTIVPDYVTESGFTTDIGARTKVGAPGSTSEFFIFDREKDTVYQLSTAQIPGIYDAPDYAKDYPARDTAKKKIPRAVTVYGPAWNQDGSYALVDIRSSDNKDRWLMLLDPASGKLTQADRQRDEAWIGGPGISSNLFTPYPRIWIDNSTFWFKSEATGYMHLYTYNVKSGKKTALTSGAYEVQEAQLSKDRSYFYITTNEVHPGEKHFYRLKVSGGIPERITTMTGAHETVLSPDEKHIAFLYSYSNKPWELYLMENKPGARQYQVTTLAQTDEFRSYPWMDPKLVTFRAADGAEVHARLYKPANAHPSKPAVIFVHGAGYLQNVHRWWSSYFREYMFHNLLAEQGYTVLDIDYRGSSGYGRDWRTGIYRHMGGKDLSDHVDGAKYLVEQHGINPSAIGIYGGSYGGFITLMAMFTKPGTFASGAALRSVTDWAHYNDPYTSNILNEPFNDSLAYARSSPIYYAQGLQGHLLMCHGMVDVNVHFQDIVRLTQRLIELGKENWELAVYPVEDHAFVEPSSWTDEYKRILKLFNNTLKQVAP